MTLKEIIIPDTQLTGLRFEEVINKLTRKTVLKYNDETSELKPLITWLKKRAEEFVNAEKGKQKKARNNEIGIDIQNNFFEALTKSIIKDWTIKKSSKGYPDYIFENEGNDLYLECKAYERISGSETKEQDTLRSFYLSPSITETVKKDGYHFVIGFEFTKDDRKEEYTITKCTIIDSYLLTELKLKYEFNTNNLHMYTRDKIYTYPPT